MLKYLVTLNTGRTAHAIAESLKVGDRVEAYLETQEGEKQIFPGVVTSIQSTFPLSRRETFIDCADRLGLNREQVAALCNVEVIAVERWMTGKTTVSNPCLEVMVTNLFLSRKDPATWRLWIAERHWNLFNELGLDAEKL